MERQSKESRSLEAHCRGGQGPPRVVAPSGGEGYYTVLRFGETRCLHLQYDLIASGGLGGVDGQIMQESGIPKLPVQYTNFLVLITSAVV